MNEITQMLLLNRVKVGTKEDLYKSGQKKTLYKSGQKKKREIKIVCCADDATFIANYEDDFK